ncbi:MAG: polymer-forming cytoskeletal protein [Lentisphaerales bacterium]|jgi:cytoskeletal protein CcmA (bactofilin family)|nr:MAG: polymer-forming cytoskeletal protein [Lentisphaerales bacterium]
MAKRRSKNDIVDGFTTMKAAQRAVTSGKSPKTTTQKAGEASSKPKPEPARSPKTRIDHTTQPTRHNVECYECRYGFVITGLLKDTFCPKCKSALVATEYSLDKRWAGNIKTIGTVHITEKGVVGGGKIVAGNVILAGSIEGGKTQVIGRLEARAGGRFKPEVVDARDLIVRDDASLSFETEIRFRNIDVAGKLSASIVASGIVMIRSTGHLLGKVCGKHLVVENGAGLNATLDVA